MANDDCAIRRIQLVRSVTHNVRLALLELNLAPPIHDDNPVIELISDYRVAIHKSHGACGVGVGVTPGIGVGYTGKYGCLSTVKLNDPIVNAQPAWAHRAKFTTAHAANLPNR